MAKSCDSGFLTLTNQFSIFYFLLTSPGLNPQIPKTQKGGQGLSLKSQEEVLIVQKSWNDPLWPFSQPNWPGGQQDQGHGHVLHDQGEGYQQPITFRSGSRQLSISVEKVSLYFLGGDPIPYIGLVPRGWITESAWPRSATSTILRIVCGNFLKPVSGKVLSLALSFPH